MSSPYSGLYLKSYCNTIEHKFINQFIGQNVITSDRKFINKAIRNEMTEELDVNNVRDEEEYEEVDEYVDCGKDTECYSYSEEVIGKRSSRVVYERDSMERFGDDLTEEVLSHLWFSDKVMFECLSKQWQRLVFNKQFELDLNLYTDFKERKNTLHRLLRKEDNRRDLKVDIKLLESLLKKCPNVRRVYLNVNEKGKELELITKYCRRVTKLIGPKCCNEECLMSFAAKHGMWLQEFGIDECGYDLLPEYLKKFLQLCPNIKSIDIPLD